MVEQCATQDGTELKELYLTPEILGLIHELLDTRKRYVQNHRYSAYDEMLFLREIADLASDAITKLSMDGRIDHRGVNHIGGLVAAITRDYFEKRDEYTKTELTRMDGCGQNN